MTGALDGARHDEERQLRAAARQLGELIGAQRRWRWIALVVLAATVSAFEAVGALFVYVLLRLVTEEDVAGVSVPVVGDLQERFPSLDQRELVLATCAVVGGFFVVRAVLYLTQSYVQNRVAFNTAAMLATRLLHGYLAVPYPTYVRRSSAEAIRNAHESVQLLAQQVLVPGVMLVSEALLVLVVFAVLVAVAPAVTLLVVVVLLPLVIVLVRGLQPQLLRQGRTSQEMSQRSLQWLTQTLVGYRDIKMLGRESYFERRFGESRFALSRAFYLRSVFLDTPRVGVETGLILFIVVFLALSVGDEGPSAKTITILGFFAYAGLRVLPSLNRIMISLQSIRFGLPLVGHLHDDLTGTTAAIAPASARPVTILSFERDIALSGITVRYEGTERPALHDVDLRIVKGEWIGVVGPTGGGKSTLIDVLIGLLEPTTGRVEVDGRAVWPDPRGWHQRVGIVPQVLFLLDDTIRRNIALGVEDGEIDDERVREAARLAHLDRWVDQLPAGLDTLVGERGVKLSGGQRQRVVIARALYHDPALIVFDEGTSALDQATEADVIDALHGLRGERTLVTVAHRLSTVRPCDRIAVVDGGRIVAQGSYADLESTSAEFRSLSR